MRSKNARRRGQSTVRERSNWTRKKKYEAVSPVRKLLDVLYSPRVIISYLTTFFVGLAVCLALFDPLPTSLATFVGWVVIAICVAGALLADRLKEPRSWLVGAAGGSLLVLLTLLALIVRAGGTAHFVIVGRHSQVVSFDYEVSKLAWIAIPLGITYIVIALTAYFRATNMKTKGT